MSLGIKSAPSAFQRIMSQVLREVKFVLCYLDDILISASTKEKLAKRLRLLLQTLKDNNILINKEKSIFETKKIEWVGYELISDGIRSKPEKSGAIQHLKYLRMSKK